MIVHTRHEQRKQEAEKQRLAAEKRRHAKLHRLLRNPDFRAVVAQWLDSGQVYASSFTDSGYDAYHMGRRSLAVDILNECVRAGGKQLALELFESWHFPETPGMDESS